VKVDGMNGSSHEKMEELTERRRSRSFAECALVRSEGFSFADNEKPRIHPH
jgi:hypothetical protein